MCYGMFSTICVIVCLVQYVLLYVSTVCVMVGLVQYVLWYV